MKTLVLRLLGFVLLVFGSPSAVQADVIFSVDYEDGTFGAASKTTSGKLTTTGYSSLCCAHSAKIVNSPVRTGTKAVKMTLLPTDEGYLYGGYRDPVTRAEFEKWNLYSIGDAQWYGFSVYIDPAWKDSTSDPNGAVLAQWHSTKDSCDQASYANLTIRYKETTNSWIVKTDSDSNACSTSTSYTRQEWSVGSAAKGVWVDWVIYVKWSYQSDGILKVWKNGQLVLDKTGPNAFNNAGKGGFLKWGVYKSWWSVKTPAATDILIAYYDSLKVGDANSSYNDVAPNPSSSGISSLLPNQPSGLTTKLQ
jgi:polysaccharide lyase-like protein